MSHSAPAADVVQAAAPATAVTAEREYLDTGAPVDYARLAIVTSVLAGVIFRILQYGGGRSLWLDEVLVARAVIERSFSQLLQPVSWGASPPGFLLLTKANVSIFGGSEYALRLLPLAAGIASIFLFLPLARQSLTARAVPIAVALFSLSPFLIYYSSEVKPYSSDAAISVLLLLGAFRLRENGVSLSSAVMWGLGVLLAAAVSLPALLVGMGVTLALATGAWRRGDRPSALNLASVAVVWSALMAGAYLLVLHGSPTNEYARAFWRSGFMPLPPQSVADLWWFPRTFLQVFRDPLGVMSDEQSRSGIFAAGAAMIAFTAGCAWMLMRRRSGFWILLAPILVTLLASGLMLYPFGGSRASAGRVLLFLAPMFFLLIAQGAERIWESLRGPMRAGAAAVLGLLLLPSLAWAVIAVPLPRTEIKPLLDYLEEEQHPADFLYVHYDIRHAFEYYMRAYQISRMSHLLGPCARERPAAYIEALSQLRGAPRVWVLLADGEGAGWISEKRVMLDYLDHVGERLDDQVSGGASLYLYDLRAKPGGGAAYEARLPTFEVGMEDGCALWN